MSRIQIDAVDSGTLERANMLLAGIPGGFEKALRNAAQRAGEHLRTASANAVRERYAISKADIRANENVKLQYKIGSGGVSLVVTFSGQKIPLYRYEGTNPKEDVRSSNQVPAVLTGNWRSVHPSVPASAHQLKTTSPTQFQDAFVVRMKSGHKGIFERTGGATFTGGDAIRELMGSSVPQMLGSQEVSESLAQKAANKFKDRLDQEVYRILNGWGG